MVKVIFKLVILLFLFQSASAQIIETSARFNGIGNSEDQSRAMAVDISGNVYVTGYSKNNNGDYDFVTMKYNSALVLQWGKRFGWPYNEFASAIAVDVSGNVYVLGTSVSTVMGSSYLIVKYDSLGVEKWYVETGYGPSAQANSIAVDGSGNVYVTGYANYSAQNDNFDTKKLNSSGVLLWEAFYNGNANGSDVAKSIGLDGLGNVYVSGYGDSTGFGADYVTIRYSPAGVRQWVKKYSGPLNDNDYVRAMVVDYYGNVYVTGKSKISENNNDDYVTLKYNSSGEQQGGVMTFNGATNSNDGPWAIYVDGGGNIYVTGGSRNGPRNLSEYGTVKYNSSGVEQWRKIYSGNGSRDNIANSIAVDVSGNVYVTGKSSTGSALTSDDFATIKYQPTGNMEWLREYNGPVNGSDIANSVKIFGSNVYVTGPSTGTGTNYDYFTIRYAQGVGVQQISSLIPDHYSLSQNYPNPFNPTTKIKFDIVKPGFAKLTVFDISGKEVATLANENLSVGSYETEFDGSKLSSGIYFYTLTSGDFTQTKKLMLLK